MTVEHTCNSYYASLFHWKIKPLWENTKMLVIRISPLTFIDDQINPNFKKIAYANFMGKWVNAGNLHLIILISFAQCFAPLQPILLSYLQLAKKWFH